MSEMLNSILQTMELYQATYPEDACLVLTDTEKIIGYLPGKEIDLKILVGDPLTKFEGSVTIKSFRTGKVVQEERGPELFGFPYVSSATPIFENGKLVGVLAAIVSNKKIEALRSGANELSAAIEQMFATTEEVTKASDDVAGRLQELSAESKSMTEDIQQIHSILSFVQEIANQSNLLGLNAAIEAARAGEHGRGFTVVANEIRKMADKSKESAKKIQEQLSQVQGAIERMNESIQQIAAYTEEHSASMQELNSTFSYISKVAQNLNDAI